MLFPVVRKGSTPQPSNNKTIMTALSLPSLSLSVAGSGFSFISQQGSETSISRRAEKCGLFNIYGYKDRKNYRWLGNVTCSR